MSIREPFLINPPKRRRRNPGLMIVNPYDEKLFNQRKKMEIDIDIEMSKIVKSFQKSYRIFRRVGYSKEDASNNVRKMYNTIYGRVFR